jgi:hypothetical protein
MKHSGFLQLAFTSHQVRFLGGHRPEIPGRKLETVKPSILFVLNEPTIRKYAKKGSQKHEPLGQHPSIAAEAGKQTFHDFIDEHEKRKLLANNESLQYIRAKHKLDLNKG